MTEEQYLLDNTEFFQPLEQIAEALRNNEGISGMSSDELMMLVNCNDKIKSRIQAYM